MTRRVSVTVGVALALFLSVLAATGTPASAAHTSLQSDDLVVGAQHDTVSEFETADKLHEMYVGGEGARGDNGEVVLRTSLMDGFEDEPADAGAPNAWNQRFDEHQPAAVEVTTTRSYSGSQSVHITGDSSGQFTDYILPEEQPYGSTTANVSVAMQAATDEARFLLTTGNEEPSTSTRVIMIALRDGELQYFNGSFHTITTVSTDTWVDISVTDVDPATDSLDITYNVSGGDQGTINDVATENAMDNGYTATLLAAGGTGEAYFDDYSTSAATDGQYVATHTVTSADQAALNITQYQDVSVNAVIQTPGGSVVNQSTLSGTGNHTLSLSSYNGDQLETVIEVSPSGSNPQFELADETILFTNHAPQASNFSPQDGAQLTESTPTFSVDVSDPEFSTAQGDSVEARLFLDGTQVGSETVTSNGTVSIEPSVSEGGMHSYYWEFEDEYGEVTTSSTRSISTPSTLYVRNVSAPSELVTSGTAQVTFYGGEDEETIVEREVTNGTASLTDLPIDEEFTAVVQADDYYTRQVVVQNLYEQSGVYMLSRNESDVVEITFQLDDKTGRFSGEDTQLIVQRPITLNNSTDWRNVVADDISASSEISTLLVNQQRYRLIVQNDQQARILGAYTPSGPADPEVIPVGEIRIGGDAEVEGTLFGAEVVSGQNASDGDQYVRVQYRDPRDATQSIDITIENESGTVLYDSSTSGPFGTLTETIPVNTTPGEQLTVLYEASRDGQPDASGEVTLGRPQCAWCIAGLDDRLVNILAAISVVAVLGLIAPQNGPLAGAAAVVWSGALVVGFGVPIPGPMFGLATGYAVVFLVGRSGGPQ